MMKIERSPFLADIFKKKAHGFAKSLHTILISRPFAFAMILAPLMSACEEQVPTLKPLDILYKAPPAIGLDVNFCTNKSEVLTTKIKYLFVLDQSTSNERNYLINQNTGQPAIDGSGALVVRDNLGTDPDGSRRYSSLIDFLNKSPANDPLRYYSLITFSDNLGLNTAFSNDRNAVLNTVLAEKSSLADNGATNYEGALDAVYQKINTDIAAARNNPLEKIASTYIVVFISDGFPILNISLNPLVVRAQNRDTILGKVRNIVSLQAENLYVDSINFFTGYYYVTGNTDQRAENLLKDMAELVGNGIGYTFGSGKSVDFSYFTVPSKVLHYQLADVFVSNQSTIWWQDGRYLADTDGDGLPDEIETANGSNPNLADSDGNGVNDYIEYYVRGTPCANASCSVTGAHPFRALSASSGGCSSSNGIISLGGGRIGYQDSDRDGLNDCEELVLQNPSGVKDFDSNGDHIPDGLSFRSGLNFVAGTDLAAQSKFEDGFTNYEKIKQGLPTTLSYKQLLNPKPYEFLLSISKADAAETCYNLRIKNFTILGPNNKVRVTFSQITPLLSTRRVFSTAEKKFDNDSPYLHIGSQAEESTVWQ